MNLTPKDEWLIGYAEALAKTHPEMSARERFVAACREWREMEEKAHRIAETKKFMGM